ncbi:uncharacterized protein LOC129280078 [Lytechinus pictus]|uniref:uncharacterized protein LOC129280078 n=1 Tax=Lytechinus pictus TaxID=7653 RepID=UPI0030B9FC06
MNILRFLTTCALWLGICILECSSRQVWDVRLWGNPMSPPRSDGIVEIYLGSKGWFGTCDKEWGINEAIVVCRQLGFPGAIGGFPNVMQAGGSLLLSREWRCSGTENALYDCINYHPTYPCYQFAGVKCHEPGYLGCFQDTFGALTSTLVDNVIVEPDMTVDRCRQFCMFRHYRLYGLKNGNECYCGLVESEIGDHTKLSDAQCQTPCPGDFGQVCGGNRTDTDKLSVFDVNMGECENPGTPENGVQLESRFMFGDIVRFACMPGYELLGIDAIQCVLAPGGPGMGVMWSTPLPYCALIKMTSPPAPTTEPTTTKMTTTPTTTMRETTTTMKTTTTQEPVKTTSPTTTERRTTARETTTAESSKMMLTEERTTTEEIRVPVVTTPKTTMPSDEPSSSTSESMTKRMTSERQSTEEMTSDESTKTTMAVEERVNDVTNYTDYITKPTTAPGNKTGDNDAGAQKAFNLFTMIREHSILIALGGTFLILLIPIIVIVIFKKACRRKKSPSKIQIERNMEYQLGSETTGFTYEPQPQSRPRYQSFRRGFKRFSKRPWSDREEDSSDEEL